MFFKKNFLFGIPAIYLSIIAIVFCSCSSSYKKNKIKFVSTADLFVDTTIIPYDTIAATNSAIFLNNGLYFLNKKKFSGIVSTQNSDRTISSFTSIYNGMKHGMYRSYYSSGKPFEVRQYKNNLATGRHTGYFENGNMQFDYLYFEEKKAGYFKKWYSNGKPYLFANYKNDVEEGLQQGWRPNGKLFLNYVAKDGRTYGLQETMLCYTLKDEELKETQVKK